MVLESYMTYLRMLSSGVPRLLTAQREIRWDRYFTTVIKGKTLVVVSLGEGGEVMASAGRELGLKVVCVDLNNENPCSCGVAARREGMKAAFESADFLAICDASAMTVDSEKLEWLPARAAVLNVSGNRLACEGRLVEKLCTGELSGAILEIGEAEGPPVDSPLWTAPNLVLIPRALVGVVC